MESELRMSRWQDVSADFAEAGLCDVADDYRALLPPDGCGGGGTRGDGDPDTG